MFGDCYGWREAPHQTQLPNFFSPQLTLLPELMICLVADSLSSNGSWSTLKPLKCKCAKSQEHIRHHMHTTMAILCPRVSLDKSVCVELCIKMIFNIFIKIFNQCKWIPIVKFLVPLGFMRNVVVSIWPFAKPRNHSCETIKISWDDYWERVWYWSNKTTHFMGTLVCLWLLVVFLAPWLSQTHTHVHQIQWHIMICK